MQTRKEIMREVNTNIIIGVLGSFLITYLCTLTLKNPLVISIVSVVGCTIWSYVRNYSIRSYFNQKSKDKVDEDQYQFPTVIVTHLKFVVSNGIVRLYRNNKFVVGHTTDDLLSKIDTLLTIHSDLKLSEFNQQKEYVRISVLEQCSFEELMFKVDDTLLITLTVDFEDKLSSLLKRVPPVKKTMHHNITF